MENPIGLRLKFYVIQAEPNWKTHVRTEFTPQTKHAGFKGIVHGGVLATLLDETMFWAAVVQMQRFCVSAEISVRFKQKALVGRRLIVLGRVVMNDDRTEPNQNRRIIFTEGEILDAETNKTIATASAKFMPLDASASAATIEDFYPNPEALKNWPSVG